jgi:putative FmdB family regulatory protein
MPIYEYQCLSCGKELEALQKISDAPLLDCPACGEPRLNKKVSAVAFRLKGGGWYETDFKTGNKKNLAGGADGAAPSASTSAPAASPGESKSSSSESKSGSSESKSSSGDSKSSAT